ncbi:hypothetical protein OFM35_31180, partial [Escherichia coli]|nr:hypothetical protein [Escherichia coli]
TCLPLPSFFLGVFLFSELGSSVVDLGSDATTLQLSVIMLSTSEISFPNGLNPCVADFKWL